ncbi:MAG: hypothetical protein RLZZ502_893, partial [Pseudomonadota bacterium]
MSSTNPLRLGILGCANIAKAFVRDVAPSKQVSLCAVASRVLATAQTFAQDCALTRATSHGSYEALLADPDIDAVYIPLPNHLHAEWAIRAAQSGKHIMCEKPLTLSLADAQAMFAAAEKHGVVLLEAYPYRFQPQTNDLLALLTQDTIGQIRSMHACFGFSLAVGTNNIRWQPLAGGGALLDAGSYPLSLIRLIMGQAPTRVLADARWAETGVDIGMTALLRYADGRQASMSCAMDAANHRQAVISGSKGTLETEYLNHTAAAGMSHPLGFQVSSMRLRRGVANNIPFEPLVSAPAATGSGFLFAAEAFAALVASRDSGQLSQAKQ